MQSCDSPSDPKRFDGIEKGLKDLLHAQLLVGKEALKLVTDGVRGASSTLGGLGLPSLKGHSCCAVPEPCWMPLSLGEFCCTLKSGDTGTVCLVITNDDFRPHPYQVAAAGKSAGFVTLSQTDFTLGPMQRTSVTATFTMPDAAQDERTTDCSCIEEELLLWVQGCRNHYLRWTFKSATQSKKCCREVDVIDRPDYVLHWYDHFYVTPPCLGPATAPVAGGGQ